MIRRFGRLRMDERGKHPTPCHDRVLDGRHLMAQEDQVHDAAYYR